jgi:transcription initiation factor TFIID TATA-box-binding protein
MRDELHISKPRTQNVVTTLTSDAALHLPTLVRRLGVRYGCEYNPKRFAAITMRIREKCYNRKYDLTATALFFRSGKIVCTGARSIAQSRWALIRFVQILRSSGFPVSFRGYEVQNMVASVRVNGVIDLHAMASANAMNCSYEPQQFPGLIFRVKNINQVCLVFKSGQVVITGAKKQQDIDNVFNTVHPIILSFVIQQGTQKLIVSEPLSDSEYSDSDPD